ncbi:MAG: hypothetical protein ACI4UO_04385 [Paludibacteraceae bacterium]
MKKLFSFVCALICAASLNAKTVYLDASPIGWDKAGAKIAAWVWTNDGTGSWAGNALLSKNQDGLYTAEVGDNNKIIFVRLNNSVTTPDWGNNNANVWDQTATIDISTDSKNVYKLTQWSSGEWCDYAAPRLYRCRCNSDIGV